MIPVYQQPMDGQCMRAVICSLLEIPMELGPPVQCEGHTWSEEEKRFVCTIPEHKRLSEWKDHATGEKREKVYFSCDNGTEQDEMVDKWLAQFGLRLRKEWASSLKLDNIPPGLCIVSGGSPRFGGNHVVVWDTRLKDMEHPWGRMVHDPTPEVPEGERITGVASIERFYWFEVVDPALMVKLHDHRVGHSLGSIDRLVTSEASQSG